MPDTVTSSLWLSLVDMLVVFAVLAFLMLVCYGLKFFSRGSRDEGSTDDEDSQIDAAAGDEPASELPMVERPEQLATMPAMVGAGHVGTDGAISIGQDAGGLRTATAQSRIFRITVNGKAFEVGVEQATGTQPVVPVCESGRGNSRACCTAPCGCPSFSTRRTSSCTFCARG